LADVEKTRQAADLAEVDRFLWRKQFSGDGRMNGCLSARLRSNGRLRRWSGFV
jgi:hypothetical protein